MGNFQITPWPLGLVTSYRLGLLEASKPNAIRDKIHHAAG